MVTVAFLGLNDVGRQVFEWLCAREEVTMEALIRKKEELEQIRTLEPDLIVSAGFRHIVPDDILQIPQFGAVNLHKSYLPYNRGANPNVWSLIEDNPAGVSIHYMTAEIDGGPIIDRRKVPTYPDDTAKDLYERLERAQVAQFEDVWPAMRDGTADTIEPELDEGTYHKKRDFVDLWELARDEETTVGELIDRLRALTFPPYKNAYFEAGGEKYFVEIEITPESEVSGEGKSDREIPDYAEDDFE